MSDHLTFDDFPLPTYDEWKQAAIDSLKGGDFEKLLTTPTDEGITLQPLYTAAHTEHIAHQHTLPGRFPYVRGTSAAPRAWEIAQEINLHHPQDFNAALLHDLAHGQTTVSITAATPNIHTFTDLQTALNGVDLTQTPIILHGTLAHAAMLFALVAHPQQLRGVVAEDPFELWLRGDSLSFTRSYEHIAAFTRYAITHAPHIKTVLADLTVYHDAGATAVQTVAYALATGAEHIRGLLKHGLSIDEICERISFQFSIGGQFFMEIAKFRAARMLWAQVVRAFGGHDDSAKMHVYAKTGHTNKANFDAHVNMLRTTTEALSAAIAGVDAMHVAPFDATFQPADEFSRRVARNQQVILQQEVNLARLIDPAGGSYAVEYLTEEIAARAWAAFQHIEAAGGLIAVLKTGSIQAEVAAVASKQAQRYATRRDKLVGVNAYVDVHQPRLTPRQPNMPTATAHQSAQVGALPDFAAIIQAVQNGATLHKVQRVLYAHETDASTITPLMSVRYAATFEALRDTAHRHTAKHGHAPRIFLANLGALRRHKARADFALGFFSVGGFEVINPAGFDTPQSAATAALASGAGAVVICGMDEDYVDVVPPLAEAVKAQNPQMVVIVAGRLKEPLKGVDESIYVGADCLALNQWLQEKITHVE